MWSRNAEEQTKGDNKENKLMPVTKDQTEDSYGSDLSIDPEKTIPEPPKYERQICLDDARSLTNFLKLSRLNVDDSIRIQLNAFINHHESKSKKSILSFKMPDHQSESPCLPLIRELIFPQWYKRLDAIKYCSNEVQKMSQEVKDDPLNNLSEEKQNELLRVDPYAMRDIERARVEKNDTVEALKTKWSNAEQVEGIIRDRTEGVIYDICDINNFNVKQEFIKYSNEMAHRKL